MIVLIVCNLVLIVCNLVLMGCVVRLILALRETNRAIERVRSSRSGLGIREGQNVKGYPRQQFWKDVWFYLVHPQIALRDEEYLRRTGRW